MQSVPTNTDTIRSLTVRAQPTTQRHAMRPMSTLDYVLLHKSAGLRWGRQAVLITMATADRHRIGIVRMTASEVATAWRKSHRWAARQMRAVERYGIVERLGGDTYVIVGAAEHDTTTCASRCCVTDAKIHAQQAALCDQEYRCADCKASDRTTT